MSLAPFESKRFESALHAAVTRLFSDDAPLSRESTLLESMTYSVLSPGKRIRPRLVYASAQVVGARPEVTESFAIALELIHCFSLIHDDLPCMDNDDFRRGLPTNHRKFGEAIALLAGDALLPGAIQIFSEAFEHAASPTAFALSLRTFLKRIGPSGVVGGQALELDYERRAEHLRGWLDEIHHLKTGALFIAALETPALLSGLAPDSRETRALHRFGRTLGLAFQIADDLEDQDSSPKSILHFISKAEAQNLALSVMNSSRAELESVFRNSAAHLLPFLHEIQSKLEKT